MELVPGWFYNRNGVSYWRPYLDETGKVIQDLFFNLSKDVTP